MKTHMRPAIAPAVLVMLGLLLTGCDDSSDNSTTSAESNTSASPADDPSESASSDPESAGPRHLVEQEAVPLEPGTYQMSISTEPGTEAPEVLVSVPTGYVESSDWYVVSEDAAEFLAVYAVENVTHDACQESKSNVFRPGPSVQDLADALAAQKSSRTTKPEPVNLAGYDGLYLEMTGPRDISKCVEFPAGPFDGRGIYGDNQVDRLWILDVDGQRLVLDASHAEDSPASDNDKLTAMVNSLEFVPAS